MIRTALRGIVIVVALTTVMIVINAPSRVVASPPSDVEWADYQGKIRDAEMRGDFAVAEEVSRDFYARCRTALGEIHPDTTVVAAAVRAYHKLQSLDEQAKRQFTTATTTRNAAWQRVVDNTKETIPTLDSMTELLSSFHTCSRGFPPDLPREADFHADCDGGIGRLLALARMFETAESYMASAHEYYLSTEGLERQTKGIELALAEMLREQEKDPARRVTLLKGNIAFAERYQMTERLEWWKERAMTLLAETYYCSGDRSEADRLYAEVRSRLPEKIDHDLAGWCKSWCDRHEARQLMEKGDWEGAYLRILQARLATTKYGRFNLSKGLTMERIVRMSAEIQRHRGNDKEAKEDLEYAQTIADHAARLRVALEAQLKTMANDADENGGTGAGQD